MTPGEARRLSKLLFDCRELVEMYADVVEARTGRPVAWPRRVLSEVDAYRAEQGWSPNGYGGEAGRP